MSFVAAHSKHGSWIVGVGGGLRAGTIIFDPRTLKTFRGPRLAYPKREPVLISHGSEIYAISRRPLVVRPIDCEPWFECLSFNKELVVGTYAFHVVNKTWEKIHDENLPFVGQAVPLCGSLFAACPISNNSITASASVFHMFIKVPPSTLVAAVGVLLSSASRKALKRLKVSLTALWIENIEAIMTHCQSQGAKAKDLLVAVQVKEQSHTCKSKGLFGMAVVAAFSM
ncbi:hypothetical protein Zm00014a_032392 [Zea mays]|uniref:Uncharacterized protein n=1 Tax=Zea mays TaxID=4577 RepID=A0A3L6DD17_MAIZE|nr:hypothetical protein Zm00014a_032392 [Zea mays]